MEANSFSFLKEKLKQHTIYNLGFTITGSEEITFYSTDAVVMKYVPCGTRKTGLKVFSVNAELVRSENNPFLCMQA